MLNVEHDCEIYRGIPYGAPPTGELRWRPPVPAAKWDGIFDATKQGKTCHPNDWAPDNGEDCLNLNVFVPKAAVRENRNLPVQIWIHGGAFSGGSGSVLLYDGRWFAPESDTILGNYHIFFKILRHFVTPDMKIVESHHKLQTWSTWVLDVESY